MRVLILMPIAEQRGGAEQLLRMFLAHSDACALDCSVVFLEDGPMHEECQTLGIPSTVVPAGRLRELCRSVRVVRRIVEIARETEADLIFSWMAKGHLYGAAASGATGIPCAWYQHGLPRNTTWLNRLVSLLPAAGVAACSETVARVQRQGPGAYPVQVVPPCVNLAAFDPADLPTPAEARRTLGLPQEGPLIGMVGRLQRWKGMHTLIDAMPTIIQHAPHAQAVIVGGRHAQEPEYPKVLTQKIGAAGLHDHVHQVGYQANVALWMQAMDVFVHASDREPFGIVILEAMSLGKPVVATDQGGPTEIIAEEQNGLLAPYEDADVLAERVLRYLRNPGFAARIGRNARQRAQDFSPSTFACRFTDALHSIAGKDVQPEA